MTELMQQASERPIAVSEAVDSAKTKGQELKTQTGSRVREQVQDRARQVGEQAQSLAQTMRRTGAELRAQGQEGQGAIFEQLAMRVEKLAGYLTSSDADSLLGDAQTYGRQGLDFVRQRRWLVAGGGVAVGIVAARLVSRGSDGSEGS